MKALHVPRRLIRAVSVICRQGSRYLLVRRKNPPFQHWFSFPGGKVRKGEAPHAAAGRELLEETGLHAARLVHFATLDMREYAQQQTGFFLSTYCALDINGTARAGDDAASLHWLSLPDMKAMRVIPSVYALVQQIEDNRDAEGHTQ